MAKRPFCGLEKWLLSILALFLLFVFIVAKPASSKRSITQKAARQSVVMDYAGEYEVNETSIYWFDRLEKPFISIEDNYRKIEPSIDADLDKLACELVSKKRFDYLEFGNIFIPFLLNEGSLSYSIDDYYCALKRDDLNLFILEVEQGQYHHRFFLFSPNLSNEESATLPSYCYTQSWNDSTLRAQPLFEALWYSFDENAWYYIMPDKYDQINLFVLGYDLENYLTGYQDVAKPAILGWDWDEECSIWKPMCVYEIMESDAKNSEFIKGLSNQIEQTYKDGFFVKINGSLQKFFDQETEDKIND